MSSSQSLPSGARDHSLAAPDTEPSAASEPNGGDFDDMHHALGRPDGPWVEPYRNRYVCEADGEQARRFIALGWWTRAGTMNNGRDGIFCVNEAGRVALNRWMLARNAAAGLRPWIVGGGGFTTRTILAKTRSAARYALYREISDIWPDSYGDFLKLPVNVRAA
jgi:hypothetical protein